MHITGNDPKNSSALYVRRGPKRSHSQPVRNRASTVMATDAITVLPTCAFVSFRSSRTTAISGAMPNHATKQTKKANQERWNARIGAVLKSSKRTRVALPSES